MNNMSSSSNSSSINWSSSSNSSSSSSSSERWMCLWKIFINTKLGKCYWVRSTSVIINQLSAPVCRMPASLNAKIYFDLFGDFFIFFILLPTTGHCACVLTRPSWFISRRAERRSHRIKYRYKYINICTYNKKCKWRWRWWLEGITDIRWFIDCHFPFIFHSNCTTTTTTTTTSSINSLGD